MREYTVYWWEPDTSEELCACIRAYDAADAIAQANLLLSRSSRKRTVWRIEPTERFQGKIVHSTKTRLQQLEPLEGWEREDTCE